MVDVLELYEPGNDQYLHLQNVDFGKNINVRIHNEAFGTSTNLPEERYDIITMFHVHYYWITTKERSAVMDKIFQHLKPGGILYILMLERVKNF